MSQSEDFFVFLVKVTGCFFTVNQSKSNQKFDVFYVIPVK